MKMQRTIIIRRDYLHFIKKYGRFEKRHTVSFFNYLPVFKIYVILKKQEVRQNIGIATNATYSSRPNKSFI